MLPFRGTFVHFFGGEKRVYFDVTFVIPWETFPPEPRFTGGAKAGGFFFGGGQTQVGNKRD